ncbi:MAG: ESX secretion-associated protein EspG [Mycobacteriaceae bacterium]|nr:ESX secretion-associated protein EspG [Mycobacteriaceae bacterium]
MNGFGALEMDVQTAVVLQSMLGIDCYPAVLAILPQFYNVDDAERAAFEIRERLRESGVLVDGRVQPQVAHWLRCLHRPDIEAAARIFEVDPHQRQLGTMLRMTFVRAGDTHVLATRCLDQVAVQQLSPGSDPLAVAAAAISAAFGAAEPLSFDAVTAPTSAFDALGGASGGELRRGLVDLGATVRTASVLARELPGVHRRAEIVLVEHHDGRLVQTPVGVGLLATPAGRVVTMPSAGADGAAATTFTPGDEVALAAAVRGLLAELPAKSWTDTARGDWIDASGHHVLAYGALLATRLGEQALDGRGAGGREGEDTRPIDWRAAVDGIGGGMQAADSAAGVVARLDRIGADEPEPEAWTGTTADFGVIGGVDDDASPPGEWAEAVAPIERQEADGAGVDPAAGDPAEEDVGAAEFGSAPVEFGVTGPSACDADADADDEEDLDAEAAAIVAAAIGVVGADDRDP